MAQVTFQVKPATPQKRAYDDSNVRDANSAPASASTSHDLARQSSPAPSSGSSLTDLSSTIDKLTAAQTPTSGAPPAKKRKLTFHEKEAEKAAKQKEKGEKERAKEEERQRKADEKAQKDDEKKRKAEEKEEEKRIKDLEKAKKQAEADEKKKARDTVKAEKEAKKAKEEEEKLKKERNQKRLGSFFTKPKAEPSLALTVDNVSGGVSSRRSSIASLDETHSRQPTPSPKKPVTANPEYKSCFLDYQIQQNTELAPSNRWKGNREADFTLETGLERPEALSGRFTKRAKILPKSAPVKTLMRNVQESGVDVIELDTMAMEAINHVKLKVLQFKEDVRPPYQGSYTRAVPSRTSRKLSRNPFSRELPDTNYDYDSEAEWEPPAEDDEELGDDEQPSDDEGEDEMADFLDDEEDIARRRGPVSDMIPVCSGICWHDEDFDDHGTSIRQYEMDMLHDSTTFPIDPFSTKHWSDEFNPKATTKQESTNMLPPSKREPLSSLSPNTLASPKQAMGIDGKPIPATTNNSSTSTKAIRLVAPDMMEDFKKAISGSDLTKAGLIEVLKRQFPSCPKDAIKSTLETVAKREGKKEADKRWVLV